MDSSLAYWLGTNTHICPVQHSPYPQQGGFRGSDPDNKGNKQRRGNPLAAEPFRQAERRREVFQGKTASAKVWDGGATLMVKN